MSDAHREQLFKELIEIVTELGWRVAVPDGPPGEEVPGLVVGNAEYVKKMSGGVGGRPS